MGLGALRGFFRLGEGVVSSPPRPCWMSLRPPWGTQKLAKGPNHQFLPRCHCLSPPKLDVCMPLPDCCWPGFSRKRGKRPQRCGRVAPGMREVVSEMREVVSEMWEAAPEMREGCPRDVGGCLRDAGGCPTDAGGFPRDAGDCPTNAGGCPRDVGGCPRDAGGRSRDAGGCARDAGGRPGDADLQAVLPVFPRIAVRY